jgi:hypothetical protein
MCVSTFEVILLEEGAIAPFNEHLAWRFISRHDLRRFDGLEFLGHFSNWALNAFAKDEPSTIVSGGDEISDDGVE